LGSWAARGADSDVDVRDDSEGLWRCVRCSLRYGEGDFTTPLPPEMRRHLLLHREEGERVPSAVMEAIERSETSGR
jgi:hypothetical protein